MRMELFQAIDWYLDDPLEPVENPGDIAVKIETQGLGISVFIEDGTCIGCGGILYWGEKEAEAWIRINRKGLEYKKEGIRAIWKGWRIIARSCRDMDIICWVDSDWIEAQRLVRWLGFNFGKEMRKLNNKTYNIWEYKHGNHVDDLGNGSICRGTDATGSDDEVASQRPSRHS